MKSLYRDDEELENGQAVTDELRCSFTLMNS